MLAVPLLAPAVAVLMPASRLVLLVAWAAKPLSRIVRVATDGGGSDILINRGSQDGVHNGATGSIGGFSFTVRNVTATRCHGKVAARPDALKNFGKVRIGK